jgi:hypothetical protein
MTGFSRNPNADMRQCMYCGKHIRRDLTQCPYCREMQSEVRLAAPFRTAKGSQFRSGLLLMLMSAVIHYFAGGYSPIALPVPINSAAATHLAPLLFLSGLALTLYGVFLRVRA